MFDPRKFWREPLVHFLVIGAVLFLAFDFSRDEDGNAPNRILVDSNQVQQLTAQFQRTWLRPPTEQELAGLVEGHVREEVYYREALAMGLDQNDRQVRRLMRLKLEFILEDLSAEAPPDDEVLTAFLHENADRFEISPQLWFRQVYLNPDRRQDLAGDARNLLQELASGIDPETLGDPTMLPMEFPAAYRSEIARIFGAAFADQVVELDTGAWNGPIYSGLGVHLVLVSERREARLPELAEIRDQVEREYLAQRRQVLKDQAYQRLRQGYEIVIEPAGADEGSAVAVTAAPRRPEQDQ
jgi:hypothetical protein